LSDVIAPVDAASRDADSLTHLNIRPHPVRTMAGYRKLIRELQPDVVHSHSMLPSLLATVGDRTGLLHVRTIHAPYPYFSSRDARSAIKRQLEGFALRQTASTVVCISRSVKKSLPWILVEPAQTIYNGVASARPIPARRPPGNPLVVAAGRLEAEKGYPRLLSAFSILVRTVPEAKLAIAGEGSQRRMLENMIRELNIHRQVTLVGHVTEISAFYEQAHLFVLSSDYEGLGLAAMEALCTGCPVVSTPLESSREIDAILGDGTIYFAGDFSPEALADAIRGALRDRPTTDRDFTTRTTEARRRLSAEVCAMQYLDLYHSADSHRKQHRT
jgi:glycosyltransferase involved in cell wall biosynthesis